MDRRRAIEKARRGREEGFSWLFSAYRARVFAFVRRTYRLDDAGAKDVTQNAFIRAFSALEQLQEDDRFEPWLLRIARREALRFLSRRDAKRESIEEIEVTCQQQTRLAEQVELERLRLAIREVAAEIKPQEIRETAVAYYFGERTTTEALAEKLGVPHATVRKRLYSFRQKLKARLGAAT